MTTANAATLRTAPGPAGLDLVRSLVGYYRDRLGMFEDVHQRFGDVARIEAGPYRMYLITRPEHVKYVLQDNNHNYRMSNQFESQKPVVGEGLATNADEVSWRRQRRMMQPPLHAQNIGKWAEAMAGYTARMLDGWQRFGNQPFELTAELGPLNHQMLARVLFGIEWQADTMAFLKALLAVRAHTERRVNAMYTVPDSWPTPRNRAFHEAVNVLNRFTYGLIAEHRAGKRGDELLSMFMDARGEDVDDAMTDLQLHDELMTLFFAAYEDGVNAVAWAFYLLSRYSDVAGKLQDELARVLAGRAPTAADLPNLPYTAMVVSETLRLYPPSWGLLRDSVADDEIGGYHIPAGSMIFLDGYLSHRLPEFWPEPEIFRPERFEGESAAKRPRYAYYPFGGGPRQCIGSALASMKMQIMVAMIAQRYQVRIASGGTVEADAGTSLRPRGGMWVQVTPRT